MRILYIAPRYHTNQVPVMHGWKNVGAEVFFFAQHEGVSEVHDDVEFRLIKKSLLTKTKFFLYDKFYSPEKREGKKSQKFSPSFIWMYKNIKEIAPEVVIIRERYQTCMIAKMVCDLLGIKNVILYNQKPLSDYSDEHENPIKQVVKNTLFPRVSFTPVLYINKKKEVDYSRAKRLHRHYIPLVVDYNIGKATSVHSKLRILDVGKYRDYKNHFFLIDALEYLKDRNDLIVTIIGQVSNADEEEYYSKLEKTIAKKHLEHIVNLRKNVPFKEMNSIYGENDVLVLPSKHESAGMVILEAMSEGLCVLGSTNCGLTCYLENNDCGYSFSLDDPRNLATHIEQLCNDKQGTKEMGKKANQIANTVYSFENYVVGLQNLLKEEFDYELKI